MTPIRQHYVPRMLSRRFTDVDRRLHFFSKLHPDKGVQSTTPENLMLERYLYSPLNEDGSRDHSLEQRYSRLENAASQLFDKIEELLERGVEPEIVGTNRRLLDLFFYEQWRRVPEFHAEIFGPERISTLLRESIAEFEEKYRKITPEELESVSVLPTSKNYQRRIRVDTLKRSSGKVLAAFASKAVSFALADSKHSFLIGSAPVLKITVNGVTDLAAATTEVWLPISSRVALVLWGEPSSRGTVVPQSTALVRKVNLITAKKCAFFAGRSRELILSVKKNLPTPEEGAPASWSSKE